MFGINFNLPGKAGTFTDFTKFELLELLNNIFENSSPTESITQKNFQGLVLWLTFFIFTAKHSKQVTNRSHDQQTRTTREGSLYMGMTGLEKSDWAIKKCLN